MKLKTANPRVRGPRKTARSGRTDRSARAHAVEPSTFAWSEPLADVEPIVVEKQVVVEREVERQVVVEKQVFVDRPVEVEKQVFVDRPVEVEKQIFVERPVLVEKPVVVEKIVEKQVFVDRPVEVEKTVFVDRPVPAVVAAADDGDEAESKASKKPKKSKPEQQPKAIIIGRGPSLAAKIGRIAPKPSPVFAGAAAVLIALAGVALISPSGDNADAAHSNAKFTQQPTTGASGPATIGSQSKNARLQGKTRDPFAAKNYRAPVIKAATGPGAKAGPATAGKAAVTTPAISTPSLFAANFTTYSSFTPWAKSTNRSGNWINFGGKPTVKVVSVGKAGVDLFVVTDVEVIPETSKNFKYDKPLRQVHLSAGGVVRFADYRNIQGDDVTYTIRYGGSQLIKLPSKK